MRLWTALAVLAFSTAWIARPAQAQTRKEPVRARASFNAVFQGGESTLTGSTSKPLNLESEIVDNDGGGVIPVDGDGGVQLEVRAADAEVAAELLSDPEPDAEAAEIPSDPEP